MSMYYLFSEANEYLYNRSKSKAVGQTIYDTGQAQGCPPSVGDLRMFPSLSQTRPFFLNSFSMMSMCWIFPWVALICYQLCHCPVPCPILNVHLALSAPLPGWVRWEKKFQVLPSQTLLEGLCLQGDTGWWASLGPEWMARGKDIFLGGNRAVRNAHNKGPCLSWVLSPGFAPTVGHTKGCGDPEHGWSQTLCFVPVQLGRHLGGHCESGPVPGLQAGSQGPPLRRRTLRSFCVHSACVSAFFGIVAESGPAWSFLCLGS